MSQVWRRSEVGNHKRRSLNTRLSSGTSANTSCRSRNAPGRMIRWDLFWYRNNLKMKPTYRKKILLDYLLGGFRSTLIKGGPEPLENEINKILGLKREDRFSDHFSDLVQNICSVLFSYLLRLSIFCNAPRDLRKFPQKCQKIVGC